MSAAGEQPTYDVAIVGGGMVGASLALALAATRLRVVVIEAVAPESAQQPSFDDRTTALGNGARRILETLGAWPAIEPWTAPIRQIHVSDAGRFGFARLDAAAHGLEAFGHTVSNRRIGAALWQALQHAGGAIEVRRPARVRAIELAPHAAQIELEQAGVPARLSARLVVAADGAHSLLKQAAGIASTTRDYEQVALVANVRSECPAAGIAYERFTASGPIAVLPLFDGGYTVVWTRPAEAAALLRSAEPQDFCDQLQQCFGWRVGRIHTAGARQTYPLSLVYAANVTAARAVLIGNAAQTLHPVAAQGFNLGLRDAAVLAELIVAADDPGADGVLAEFARRRSADRAGMIAFTDRLVRLFADPRPAAALARNAGLLLFDLSPPAKRALSRVSWGFGGALPRLSRGLPLKG